MRTTTQVETVSPIERSEVEAMATAEYRRVADQLRSLDAEDWTKPTDCTLWDVRAMAGHTTGMMATFTSYRTMMGTMRAASTAAKQSGERMIDALTAKQVIDH